VKKNLLPTDWHDFGYLSQDQVDEFSKLMAPVSSWIPDEYTNFKYGLQNKYLMALAAQGLLIRKACFNFYCVVAFTAAMLDSGPVMCHDTGFKKYVGQLLNACVDTRDVTDHARLIEVVITQALYLRPVDERITL
jgi:hypothetical protein